MRIFSFLFFYLFISVSTISQNLPVELDKILKQHPRISEFLDTGEYCCQISPANENPYVYCFIEKDAEDSIFIVWSTENSNPAPIELEGKFWVFDTSQYSSEKPMSFSGIKVTHSPLLLKRAAENSWVIDSIYIEGSPIQPFPSDGDLWLSTWADDNCVYSGWGDGKGLLTDIEPILWVDCGMIQLSGDWPNVQGVTGPMWVAGLHGRDCQEIRNGRVDTSQGLYAKTWAPIPFGLLLQVKIRNPI